MIEEIKKVVDDILERVKRIEESNSKSDRSGKIDEEIEPIRLFASEACTLHSERCVPTDYAYTSYLKWAQVRGVNPCHRSTFGKAIRRAFPEIKVGTKTEKGVIERRYFGIGVNRYWKGGGWGDE